MRFCRFRFIALGFLVHGVANAAETQPAKKPLAEIIPITASNLRGQESLYREGWFIVTSTEKSLHFAKEHAIASAGDAMSQALVQAGRHSAGYSRDIAAAGQGSLQTGKQVYRGGTALTGQELAATNRLARMEMDYGSRAMAQAWEHLVQGNMTLAQRTREDRAALAAIPGDYFAKLNSDFSNLHELSDKAKGVMSTHIEGRWSAAFGEAQAAFNQSYQKSGERGNSLAGLGDIMAGYVKVAYSGLAKPVARSTVQGVEATAKIATDYVFLPVTGLFVASGRTIAATGLSLYYTTAMGIKLVSPTVEGGLLAGLSLFSYGAVPITYVAGGAAGAVNQIAVTAAAPAAAAGKAVAMGAGETGMYAVRVSYDLLKGTTMVALDVTRSGVVLGYNALTALPTQVLLGAVNSAVFLAYDGPRLALVAAKGEVQWSDEKGAQDSVTVQSLPVGSVVNLDALSKKQGVNVGVISEDPEIIQQVLKKMPQDLRMGGQR